MSEKQKRAQFLAERPYLQRLYHFLRDNPTDPEIQQNVLRNNYDGGFVATSDPNSELIKYSLGMAKVHPMEPLLIRAASDQQFQRQLYLRLSQKERAIAEYRTAFFIEDHGRFPTDYMEYLPQYAHVLTRGNLKLISRHDLALMVDSERSDEVLAYIKRLTDYEIVSYIYTPTFNLSINRAFDAIRHFMVSTTFIASRLRTQTPIVAWGIIDNEYYYSLEDLTKARETSTGISIPGHVNPVITLKVYNSFVELIGMVTFPEETDIMRQYGSLPEFNGNLITNSVYMRLPKQIVVHHYSVDDPSAAPVMEVFNRY
jgi:hypothetical protein